MRLIFLEKDWSYENLNVSNKEQSDADDAPLNLSLKSSVSIPKEPASSENVLDLILNKSSGKSTDPTVNNLSNLQNLTAGIGLLTGDSKGVLTSVSVREKFIILPFQVN